jgi:D-glycero-D-manno-heptose 1,7-bisphosphate phosphatase
MDDMIVTTSSDRPTQAVILAGGRGTRLQPLSDIRPKPMVEIHGKPFIEYMIEMLREQGFERVLFLLGYLPEVVQDYFGDGSRWGLRIDYSVTAFDDNTGRRVQLAGPFLDPVFMLLYCDNYWPMQLDRMWHRFTAADVPAMITVYSNKDGYTRSSVRVDQDGYVAVYDKTCTAPDLQGVEISYAILKKSVLDLIPEGNVLLEEALYPQLAERRQLLAYVTDHRYYSAGALHRLPITEAFFANRPAVFLDRDGVLNRKQPPAQYVRSWEEFEWLPGALEALRLLREANYRIIVVTNQAGIARGMMTEADLLDIHRRMAADVRRTGGRLDAVYYCPHHWDEGCSCRKPKPGMLYEAQHTFNLNLSRTPFIGDDERDAQAAADAGCPWLPVTPERPLLTVVRELIDTRVAV